MVQGGITLEDLNRENENLLQLLCLQVVMETISNKHVNVLRVGSYPRLLTSMAFFACRWNSNGSPILLEPEELENSVRRALNNEQPRWR